MYQYEIIPSLQKILHKLSKKDKTTYKQILGKIEEIISSADVEHYKNLRYSLKEKKRVHIGNFVLVFTFVKEQHKIIFLDFDHHDRIYQH